MTDLINAEREGKPGRDIAYYIDANYAKGTNTTEKSRRQLVMEIREGRDIKLLYRQTAPGQDRDTLYVQQGRVYSSQGISPTLTTYSEKNAHIIENEEEVRNEHTIAYSKSHRDNGLIQARGKIDGEANTCSTGDGCGNQSTQNFVFTTEPEVRIRKLTPLETERLMGWPDNWTKFGTDENGKTYELSNSARYKACGNGIVSNIPKALLDHVTGSEQGLRVFSTFAGVDGSGLYLNDPKYVKVGFSEFEPATKAQHAANVLRYHYPNVPNLGDITKIDVNDVPDHDIIFISAPCQDFSSAGRNLGIEGTKGTLFYESARIMEAKRPKYFIFENVKGLLSKKHERTFEIMCEVYSSLGYELDFELINAKHYGVAQNRERVFMIGRLK